MPLGFERMNERTIRPNALINFIKPLPGPTAETAEAILNRVAAICYPFMKKHMVLVQALEEFPYNTEFVGRNFNAGEVIQLVLRNRQGQWIPERHIMIVMVHELAHCKQMNHSKAFWAVRHLYAAELQELWKKGYTGEGLWGAGRSLSTGQITSGSIAVGDIPENLCGGAYERRRKRKRGKAKEVLSYAERKQRRILKKFGSGGQSLGADDDTKVKLEGGAPKRGKPRVAGSSRGRELRAAAALARFDPIKKEEPVIKQEEVESDSSTEDETDEIGSGDAAVDIDGKRMLDNKGRALVKICEGEDASTRDAQREMEEFQELEQAEKQHRRTSKSNVAETQSSSSSVGPGASHRLKKGTKGVHESHATVSKDTVVSSPRRSSAQVFHLDEIYKRRPQSQDRTQSSRQQPLASTCTVCSLANEPGSLICAACSNVLNPRLVPHHWKCSSSTCKGSEYVNSGDAGVCGVCGCSKSR